MVRFSPAPLRRWLPALAAAALPAPALAAPADAGIATTALQRIAARQAGLSLPPAVRVAVGTIRPAVSFTPAMPAVLRDAPDVFGSMALAVRHTSLDAHWRRAASAPVDLAGTGARGLIDALRDVPTAERAARVNAWVNARVTFTDDARGDHWSTATETLRSGRGDCEDYAIAKLQLLRAAGVSAADLYLVIAYDRVRRVDHAMLVVRAGGALLLLDNGTDRIQDATLAADYRPTMSFSANRAWIHGYAVPAPVRLAAREAEPGNRI